jgi:hypothetical protein
MSEEIFLESYRNTDVGNICAADSRVGNAWIAGFFPPIEGSICIRRERRAENNIENAFVAL